MKHFELIYTAIEACVCSVLHRSQCTCGRNATLLLCRCRAQEGQGSWHLLPSLGGSETERGSRVRSSRASQHLESVCGHL